MGWCIVDSAATTSQKSATLRSFLSFSLDPTHPSQPPPRSALSHPLSTPSSSQVSRLVRNTASTFAPRASGATGKNPAVFGSTLYKIFGVQAWVSAAVGGLLAFNLLAPSDEPSIARLVGMWSVWMFTVPALRARECTPDEKEALNLLFLVREGGNRERREPKGVGGWMDGWMDGWMGDSLSLSRLEHFSQGEARPSLASICLHAFLRCDREQRREEKRRRERGRPRDTNPTTFSHHFPIHFSIPQAIPLVNVTLPLVYKSFAAVYSADMILLAAVFAWKLGGGGKEGGGEEGEQTS